MFEKEAEEWLERYKFIVFDEGKCNDPILYAWTAVAIKESYIAGAEFGYNKANEWHKLDWEKDFPEADKLIRVRLRSGMEHICETCYYEPTEDEIGYGKLVISFYELNGEWVDDNDVLAWCYIEPFKENE